MLNQYVGKKKPKKHSGSAGPGALPARIKITPAPAASVCFLSHFNLAGAAPLAAGLTPSGVEWLCAVGGLCCSIDFKTPNPPASVYPSFFTEIDHDASVPED